MNYLKAGLIILTSLILCAGCAPYSARVNVPAQTGESTVQKPGPPPHAPAHGYRYRHHDGVQLVFNEAVGAYVAIDLHDIYFFDDLFIRISSDGSWEVSAHINGPWRIAIENEVPPKLRHAKESRGKAKGHNKNKY